MDKGFAKKYAHNLRIDDGRGWQFSTEMTLEENYVLHHFEVFSLLPFDEDRKCWYRHIWQHWGNSCFPSILPCLPSARLPFWKRTTRSQNIRWIENELQLQQNHEFFSQWKQEVPVIAPVEKEQWEMLKTVKSAIVDGRNHRGCRLTCEMESSKQAAIRIRKCFLYTRNRRSRTDDITSQFYMSAKLST